MATTGAETGSGNDAAPAADQERNKPGVSEDALTSKHTVLIEYTNWEGATAPREIAPFGLWFGATQWHPVPQWMLRAVDVASGRVKDFAMADIRAWGAPR